MSNKNFPPSQFEPLVDYAQERPAPGELHRRLVAELAPNPPASGGARREWLTLLLVGLVGFLLLGAMVLGASAYKNSSNQLTTLDARVIALSTQLAAQPTQTSKPVETTATLAPTATETPASPTLTPTSMSPIAVSVVSTTSPISITFVYALSPTIPLVKLQVDPLNVLEDPLQKQRITFLLDGQSDGGAFEVSNNGEVKPKTGIYIETLPQIGTRTLQVAVDGEQKQDLIQVNLLVSLDISIQNIRTVLRLLENDGKCSKTKQPDKSPKLDNIQVLGKTKAWITNSAGKDEEVAGLLVRVPPSDLSVPYPHLRCLSEGTFGARGLANVVDINTTFLPDFSSGEIKPPLQ